MKAFTTIIVVFLFCSPVLADSGFSPADTFFYKDLRFLRLEPSFSLVSEEEDQEIADEETESGEKPGKVFLHITTTYVLPLTYFSISLILKEFVYIDAREDNPLVHVNPVVTSVTTFGTAGFFTGLLIGFIFSSDRGFMDSFVYTTVVGVLTCIAGMLFGGIYAMLTYDSIITNDLFYYGGPVLFLFVPVFDIIRIIAED